VPTRIKERTKRWCDMSPGYYETEPKKEDKGGATRANYPKKVNWLNLHKKVIH